MPSTAAGHEIRQMIEGKLAEAGQEEFQNVQVILSGGTTGAAFVLRDEEGEFLTVKAEVKEPPEAIAAESAHEGEEMEECRPSWKRRWSRTLSHDSSWIARKPNSGNWGGTNCWCLAEYDQMLMRKDLDIE